MELDLTLNSGADALSINGGTGSLPLQDAAATHKATFSGILAVVSRALSHGQAPQLTEITSFIVLTSPVTPGPSHEFGRAS